MGYINESLSSLQDFVTKLDAFMVGEGWTQDQLDTGAGKWAIHRSAGGFSLYLSARWDTSTPGNLGLYQALGYSGGSDPGNHTDDSGNGIVTGTNATLATGRHAAITNSPLQYWAFADDYYVHVVVETATDTFLHLGIGALDKRGDWTGGEYCYGHRFVTGIATTPALRPGSTTLLDGLAADGSGSEPANMDPYCGTVHVEGFAGAATNQKWGVCMGGSGNLASFGTDRAAVQRAIIGGGFRGGPVAAQFGRFSASSVKGLQNLYPLAIFKQHDSDGSVLFLGTMKDVRGVSIEFWTPRDEVLIGSDTWVLFPTYKKYPGSGAVTSTSGYQGIAYKKIP